MRRFRFLLGLVAAAGAVALAMTSGGLLVTVLGFSAFMIFADLAVPDFQTPLFDKLPEAKRQRLRRPGP